jgi:uncharacterized protein with HEPN domain
MFHSDNELFRHILLEIEFIEKDAALTDIDDFLESEIKKRAYARSLEIIGEAVKNISNDIIVRYSAVPWRNIAGMRDKLIHGYFSVNYRLVWDVATNVIPEFKSSIKKIIIDNPEIFG